VKEVKIELRVTYNGDTLNPLGAVEDTLVVRLEEMDAAARLHRPKIKGLGEVTDVPIDVGMHVGVPNERRYQCRPRV
jgi:hypothetical protein